MFHKFTLNDPYRQSIGHDQATLVLRKEDMSDSLIGFDEDDEDGFD